jgi:hypothetical protein
MQPKPPRITRCHSCHKIYWVFLAPQLGFLPFDETGAVAASSRTLPTSRHSTKQTALKHCAGTRSRRRIGTRTASLHVVARQRRISRTGTSTGHLTSAEALANMERFIAMTENGEEDLL